MPTVHASSYFCSDPGNSLLVATKRLVLSVRLSVASQGMPGGLLIFELWPRLPHSKAGWGPRLHLPHTWANLHHLNVHWLLNGELKSSQSLTAWFWHSHRRVIWQTPFHPVCQPVVLLRPLHSVSGGWLLAIPSVLAVNVGMNTGVTGPVREQMDTSSTPIHGRHGCYPTGFYGMAVSFTATLQQWGLPSGATVVITTGALHLWIYITS